VALHLYALPFYQDLLRLLHEVISKENQKLLRDLSPLVENDPTALIRTLRQLFERYPDLGPRLTVRLQESITAIEPHRQSVLLALLEMYRGENTRYLDFYGSPRSVTTIPYHLALAEAMDFQGKAVFVGFSEQLQPEQKDGFYTVFSQPDGVDLSGVEIVATAFANLLEGRIVEPLAPSHHLLVIALWGMLLGALCFLLPPAGIIPVATALGAVYTGAAYSAFSNHALWLPLAAPLLFQLPLALLGGLLWRYLDSRRERRQIHEAFSHYLPGRVVDELIGSHEDLSTRGQLVYGICLSTDVEHYTALSETLAPIGCGQR
jgi:adenylate cyclase